jgi:hypothetical protein
MIAIGSIFKYFSQKKMRNVKAELIDIIQHNMTMTFNEESKKYDINFEYIAWQVMEYMKDDGVEHFINKINLKAIRGKGEQSFIDGCDLDDIKESYGPQHYEKEIYVDGFWQGYLEAYQDTTGLHLPLP